MLYSCFVNQDAASMGTLATLYVCTSQVHIGNGFPGSYKLGALLVHYSNRMTISKC